ncbi:uncharacterized protein HGUI_00943 [Hanseniaspora guilliermondii]|uniref:Uncharacterized protein n=1 Tax=Hanseniaspora guilliermondii TaxID=56406 RepID=A0A1L0CVB8_9ASCO|nr:uncharacterized protein HGUI_00943 [Hanseniaspora guilliermondii]
MLTRSLSLYLVMFDQKVFWREVSNAAKFARHVKKDEFVYRWIESGLNFHKEQFTDNEVTLIRKFFQHQLTNSEFLTLFEICLNEGYEVLTEIDLLYYFNRIVLTNDESPRRMVEKNFLTLKAQNTKFEELSYKRNLVKILPLSYFTTAVQYFTSKIDRDKTDFNMIKCHTDCAQMLFEYNVDNNEKFSLSEMLDLMKAHYSSVRGKMFGVEIPEKNILDSFSGFNKILLHIDSRKSKYQYITFQDFIAESLSIFSKLDLNGEKFEIFQNQFMPIFLNWMLHSTKSENHTIERLNARSKLKKKIWDMFFTSFMNITHNDTHKLFEFLEKLDPSIILMLQKYELLKYFDYSPSEYFISKAENYFKENANKKEGPFMDLMSENIANEEFLASFYYNVCIPLVQDTVGFRDLYYEYCVNRDKYFTTPDRDVIACTFVDYALNELSSYWIAFFIARTQYYKPVHSQNLGPGNPVLHFLGHPKFISPNSTKSAKLETFHRYSNNITRCINISGNKLDGFLVLALIEKAYKLRLWEGVKKWYLASYYRYEHIEYPDVLNEFVNTDIFEYICKNNLPILETNEYLVEFSKKYKAMFPSKDVSITSEETEFDFAKKKTLEKLKNEEEKKKAELLNKQSVLDLAKETSLNHGTSSLVDSTVRLSELLGKINIDSVEMFKDEEKHYISSNDFAMMKIDTQAQDLNNSIDSEACNKIVESCFSIYKSLINHVIERDVKATARDYSDKEIIQDVIKDRETRRKIKNKKMVDNY